MTTTAASHSPAAMDHLESFFHRVERDNPFLANRVSDPTGAAVDVAAIHDREFYDLVGCAQEAHRQREGVGAVVWGEAGIGKSHLLARLCRWAEEGDRACYVFLHNLQASPARLPRYVLKCLVSRLTAAPAGSPHETPLFRLIEATVPQPLPLEGGLPTSADAMAAMVRFTERLVGEHPHAGADAYRIAEVLFRFYLSAYCVRRGAGGGRSAALAARWLSGDGLDPQEAAKLGMERSVDAGGTASLADNQAIDGVLVALAELAWHGGRPLVLCFDQVDNLARDQIEALTQFLHTLLDHARNLLVVTSGVQSKLLELVEQGIILRAAWERIAQEELRLHRIGVDQARQLLEARLEHFVEPFMTVPEVKERLQEDSLFPLGRDWLAGRMGGLVEVRPRDAINWARRQWRREQHLLQTLGGKQWLENWQENGQFGDEMPPGGAAESGADQLAERIDARVAARIEEQIVQRERDPAGLPPDTGNLAGLARMLLDQCAGWEGYSIDRVQPVEADRGRQQPTYHLHLVSRTGPETEFRTAVTYISTGSATAITGALHRMLEDPAPPERILLVGEQRQPLSLGQKGKEYLEQLQARGPDRFEHIELTFREYAELDALYAAVGDARSGDLEMELPGGQSRSIGEDEAIASLHRQDRYRRHRLLGTLLRDCRQV